MRWRKMTDKYVVSVALAPFRWHMLLGQLECYMRIGNRENPEWATSLYSEIATQLNCGAEVKPRIIGDEKE